MFSSRAEEETEVGRVIRNQRMRCPRPVGDRRV